MRKKYKYAGRILTIKKGVTFNGRDVAGEDYEVEDWYSNVAGRSWMQATGNPVALNYAIRHVKEGKEENLLSDNVLYGKIGGLGFLLHVDEVIEPEE